MLALVVGEWKSNEKGGAGNSPSAAYVILSRCVSSKHVFTLQTFTPDHAEFFLTPLDMLRGEVVLLGKERSTCTRLLDTVFAYEESVHQG